MPSMNFGKVLGTTNVRDVIDNYETSRCNKILLDAGFHYKTFFEYHSLKTHRDALSGLFLLQSYSDSQS